MFSPEEIERWARAQVDNAPEPSDETMAKVARLLRVTERSRPED